MQVNFRIPEILLGALLAVAVFAMGVTFESSRKPPTNQEATADANHGSSVIAPKTSENKLTDWLLVLFNGLLFGSTLLLWNESKRSARIAVSSIEISQGIGQAQVRAYVSIKSASIFFGGDDAAPFVEITAVNSGQSPALGFVWTPVIEYLADVEPEIIYDPGNEWLNQPGVDISPAAETKMTFVPTEFNLVERVSKQREMPPHLGISVTIKYAWADVFGNLNADIASFAGVAENYKGKKRPRLHGLDTSDWGCLNLWPIEKGEKWAGIAVRNPEPNEKEEKSGQ